MKYFIEDNVGVLSSNRKVLSCLLVEFLRSDFCNHFARGRVGADTRARSFMLSKKNRVQQDKDAEVTGTKPALISTLLDQTVFKKSYV